MHLVLVHGWGFHAGLWDAVVGHLPGVDVTLVDLGFIAGQPVAGGPQGASDWPDDSIAIGHSLGLLWLLKQAERRYRALISIQGFDCFCCHIGRARVSGMRRALERDPAATLQAFWRSCGTEDFASPQALNVGALDEGLGWLMDWDLRRARAGLACPVLALASRDDAIVPATMSEAIWKDANLVWSPTGGHVLPLRRPEWCARHILEFAHAVGP